MAIETFKMRVEGGLTTRLVRELWGEHKFFAAINILTSLMEGSSPISLFMMEDILFGKRKIEGSDNMRIVADNWTPPDGYKTFMEVSDAAQTMLDRYPNGKFPEPEIEPEDNVSRRIYARYSGFFCHDANPDYPADNTDKSDEGKNNIDEIDEKTGYVLPDGKFKPCGQYGHFCLAEELLPDSNDAQDAAHRLGWIKVACGEFIEGAKDPTQAQLNKAWDLCEKWDVVYPFKD